MLNLKRILPAALALAALTTTAFAAPAVVGTWSGKVVFDTSKLPKATTPEQKKMMDDMMAQVKKMRVTLKLNSNKTFTVKSPAAFGQPAHAAEGTWKQSGQKLTLTTTKEDGKKPSAESAKPQDLTISKDGKSLTLVPPGAQAQSFKFIFTRA
jgi:NACalpha-BTF3-like transcription factor